MGSGKELLSLVAPLRTARPMALLTLAPTFLRTSLFATTTKLVTTAASTLTTLTSLLASRLSPATTASLTASMFKRYHVGDVHDERPRRTIIWESSEGKWNRDCNSSAHLQCDGCFFLCDCNIKIPPT